MVWPAGEAAFVTGAASGIGLGIARALVAAGARVALADIDGARLEAVQEELTRAGGTVSPVVLDVGDPDQWSSAADRAETVLGPISILGDKGLKAVNVAVVGGAPAESQFLGISTFLPRMKARSGRGHILNTASMAGLLPMPGVGTYSSSKFASVGLTMVLRNELAGSDIGVSLLCPGTVATRLATTAADGQAKVVGRAADHATVEQIGAMLDRGADPDRVGDQVLQAIRDRQFLIVTHRTYLPLVERLHGDVESAFRDFDGRHGDDPAATLILGGAPVIGT